ncbi:MAG TPA: hypothetical protein VI837_02225 [Blastocatellia bacterium]|nr:hypothetical protein [Blastocatellia bacterium]
MELICTRVDIINAVAGTSIDYEHHVRQRVKAASIVDPRQQVEVSPRVDLIERGWVASIFPTREASSFLTRNRALRWRTRVRWG